MIANVENTNTNIEDPKETAKNHIDYKTPYSSYFYIISRPYSGVDEMGFEVIGSKQAILELLASALGDEYEYSGTIKLTKNLRR